MEEPWQIATSANGSVPRSPSWNVNEQVAVGIQAARTKGNGQPMAKLTHRELAVIFLLIFFLTKKKSGRYLCPTVKRFN